LSLDFKPVRANLGQQVFDYLVDNIYEMDILPGSRLGVGEIADQLGISRSPVRDALHLLVAEGLVEYGTVSGYQVVEINRKYIEDVFTVRRALEPVALRLAAVELDDAQVKEICATWQKLRENQPPINTDTLDTHIKADDDFHRKIGDLSGNQVLNDLMRKIIYKATWIRRWVYSNDIPATHLSTIAEEHLEILNALRKNDIDRAVQLLDEHLIQGQAKALAFIQ
jgi:DNA-binding GntR family transcriptional regulator